MFGQNDSSEMKYLDNCAIETPHCIASLMFSAVLDQHVWHVFQPAVKSLPWKHFSSFSEDILYEGCRSGL